MREPILQLMINNPWGVWVMAGVAVYIIQFTISWWFLCNLGNKHSNEVYWWPHTDHWFVFGFSLLMGVILIPFFLIIMFWNRE